MGRPIALEDVADSLARHFSRLFNRDVVELGLGQLRESEPLDSAQPLPRGLLVIVVVVIVIVA